MTTATPSASQIQVNKPLFFLICLLLSIAVTPAMAVSSQDFHAWDTWDPVQGASLAGPAWFPTLRIPDPLALQARIAPHSVTDVREGSTLASTAHCAPVGIDGFDIHADCGAAWQVNTGVMGFLPEGQPITPVEARYTVDPVTLMPMGDHPNATSAEKQAMRDLCHEYKSTGFSYTLNDLPGYEHHDGGFRVALKIISDQNAFTRPRRESPLPQDVTNQKCG